MTIYRKHVMSYITLLIMGSFSLLCGNATSSLDTQAHEVAGLVQHFAYVSHNLVNDALKNKGVNQFLTPYNERVVNRVEKEYQEIVEAMRQGLFVQDTQTKKKAITDYANFLLSLCKDFGVRTKFFFSFPAHVAQNATVEETVQLIKDALTALEKLFVSIKPLAPLKTRIAELLFYNFLTTKIAPRVTSLVVGPSLAIATGALNVYNYMHTVEACSHRNPFYKYTPVEHDKEIEITVHPSWAQKLRDPSAQPEKQKIKPCEISPHICNQKDNNKSSWATECYDCTIHRSPCKQCYRYEGLQVPGLIHWIRTLGPIGFIPAAYLLSQAMYDAQIYEYEARIKKKEKAAEEAKVQAEMARLKVNYEQKIGYDSIKGQQQLLDSDIKRIVDYLKNPLRYRNTSSGRRSVLFYGPPGTGKTLLARAIAKESGAPFIEITADDILHENSKERILATLRLAESVAAKRAEKSAIIYIDEIDCVTGNRETGIDAERAKALANLLTIFDGIEKRNPYIHIVIIVTTNHYKNLDPALLRPGRIDRKILITYPNDEGRRQFFNDLLPADQAHLTDWLVEQSAGCSGAHIINIIDTAGMLACYDGCVKPHENHYKQALANCKAELNQAPAAAQE